MPQLPVDCLNEIFEHLEEDKISLRSCLLVNRLWCEVTVRILWRDVWSFQYSVSYRPYRTHVPLAIISTLIACLPIESKNLLSKNGIYIPTPTSNPTLFNYASFSKVLSISKFNYIIQHVLENRQSSVTSLSLDYNKHLIAQEILKMFMSQTSSLKKLEYYWNNYKNIPFNVHFTYFPGARDCLTNLSELCCSSAVHSEFFYQLSQICHNLQSLTIEFRDFISNGIADFISVQNNLKDLNLLSFENDWTDVMPALSKLSSTLIKLKVDVGENDAPMSFITSYSNLQELTLSSGEPISFKELQHVVFPNLQILKIPFARPKDEILMKFFENNGKNLKELNIDGIDKSLRTSIARFCPNLIKVSSILMNDGLETLKIIFDSCKYLESIKVWYSDYYSNESETLEVIAKHSQKNFCELKIYHEISSNLRPEDLESFLISWGDRIPKKSLTLISIKDDFWNKTLDVNEEIMEIIKKYKRLGIIKKFGTEIHFE